MNRVGDEATLFKPFEPMNCASSGVLGEVNSFFGRPSSCTLP